MLAVGLLQLLQLGLLISLASLAVLVGPLRQRQRVAVAASNGFDPLHGPTVDLLRFAPVALGTG